MILFLRIIHWALTIYYWILIAYVLGSWFPELKKSKIYYALHRIANPYMRLFRGLLVFGMMDFTPIIGFLLYTLGLDYLDQMINTLS